MTFIYQGKMFSEKQKALVDVFGSKASKRIVRNREENRVQVDNVSGANAITQTLSKKVQAQSDIIAAKKARDPKYTTGKRNLPCRLYVSNNLADILCPINR